MEMAANNLEDAHCVRDAVNIEGDEQRGW